MLLTRDDIDFSCARLVISAAQKYIIPVGALPEADPLVYPHGTERAGEPITDWQGKPVGERGLVFFNHLDQCYQAVPADGRSVIIVNEVTPESARAIAAFVRDLDQPIDQLSMASLRRLLGYLNSALRIRDIYNSTDDFIRSRMVRLGCGTPWLGEERPSGWARRDSGDVCQAVFVRGPAGFAGPAATPQQIPPDGGFIIRQGTSCHMVATAVMLRTYVNLDSSPLELASFPLHPVRQRS